MKTLEILVANHPGVMSHVCGLFARRAFNVEGILCIPNAGGATSRVWLKVNEDERLGQLIKHLTKLEDVREVQNHPANHEVFAQAEEFFNE